MFTDEMLVAELRPREGCRGGVSPMSGPVVEAGCR
jgi:hypothetical protein